VRKKVTFEERKGGLRAFPSFSIGGAKEEAEGDQNRAAQKGKGSPKGEEDKKEKEIAHQGNGKQGGERGGGAPFERDIFSP